jgi:NADPH:quinone reductase-like Zn-dependent oxidoreductase
VTSLGADEVIDYTTRDFTQTGRTYDVIFDAVGKSSFSRCKSALNNRGDLSLDRRGAGDHAADAVDIEVRQQAGHRCLHRIAAGTREGQGPAARHGASDATSRLREGTRAAGRPRYGIRGARCSVDATSPPASKTM